MSSLPLLLLVLLPIVAAASLVSSPLIRPSFRFIDSNDYDERTMAKRYDRNCFFSPVQCMLSFKEESQYPVVVTRKGKRYFFRN